MNQAPKITVQILSFNEEIHIERCIKSCSDLMARVLVVDSFATNDANRLKQRFTKH